MTALYLIDSGTSTTRLAYMEEGTVLRRETRPVGAHDGREAIARALGELFAAFGDTPAQAAVCSGMITSEKGLLEIPHHRGAVELTAIQPLRRDMPRIAPVPLYFIPGVRFARGEAPATDLVRGEETELAGYMAVHGPGRRQFIHIGSHFKLMKTEGTRLSWSVTGMTGELLDAALNHTILSASTGFCPQIAMDSALEGAELCGRYGLSRAMFAVRTMGVVDGRSREVLYSFLLGAAAADACTMIGAYGDPQEQTVIYGNGNFAAVLQRILQDKAGFDRVEILPESEAEGLAARGAAALYENRED